MITYAKEITEYPSSYDIAVAGGGVAGVAAAVSAARSGKKVLLIEKSMKLGGLATLGLINLFVPMCNGRGKQIIYGMAEELLRLSIRYGYDTLPEDFKNGGCLSAELLDAYKKEGKIPPRYMTRYSAEIFALALTKLCCDEGVELLFDTIIADTVSEENNPQVLKALIIENKSGTQYVCAKMFIDTTGDGDVLAKMQLPTTERGNFHTYLGMQISLDSCKKAAEKQNIGFATGYCSGGDASLYGDRHPAEVPLYYGTDVQEINRYLIRNQLELLDKFTEEDRNRHDIVTLPGMAQFRTTRRINADYVLQETDTYRHFEDSIGAICDFDRRDYLFEIPYRTLIRTGYPNVITAGRSAAGDGYAWDVIRVIPPAILTGQAAGIACSMAMDCSVSITDMKNAPHIEALQKELEHRNVLIHFDDADIPELSENIHENND